jgi:DNA repair exonuclease SbcCD ATPase subunit
MLPRKRKKGHPLTNLQIENFQSIKKINFQIDGLTVIVGKNNIGKSAIIRAIGSALTNAAGADYIRKGTKHTEVTFERDNLKFNWKKGDSATYTVNGESFSKLNRAIPKPMMDAGLGKLEIGDFKTNLNVASQFEEIFLLNEPGSTITEVLASIYKLDTLSLADDACQKELKGQKSLLKTRDADLKKLESKLTVFEGFEDVKKAMEKVTALDRAVNALQIEIQSIKEYEDEIQSANAEVNRLTPIKDVKPPNTDKCRKTLEEFQWLLTQEKQVQTSAGMVKGLQPIKNLQIPDIGPCNETLTKYVSIGQLISIIKSQEEKVTRLTPARDFKIPEINTQLIDDVRFLARIETDIKNTRTNMDRLSDVHALNIEGITLALNGFTKIFEGITEIVTLEDSFMVSARATKESRDTLRSLTMELDTAKTDLAAFKNCPTCERPFN